MGWRRTAGLSLLPSKSRSGFVTEFFQFLVANQGRSRNVQLAAAINRLELPFEVRRKGMVDHGLRVTRLMLDRGTGISSFVSFVVGDS